MQRQRGELVPIGEVVADLDGPVKAIRDASPQARHHFTQADQVNQLVSASEAEPDLGFMARLLALCSLPRTNSRPPERVQARQRPLYALHDPPAKHPRTEDVEIAGCGRVCERTSVSCEGTSKTCGAKWANCASAWRIWKGCWKDCARPSPCGPAPANAGPRRICAERIGEKVMNSSKKGLTKAMRSGDSIIRAESREPRAESREPRAESREPRAESREPRAESREPRCGHERASGIKGRLLPV